MVAPAAVTGGTDVIMARKNENPEVESPTTTLPPDAKVVARGEDVSFTVGTPTRDALIDPQPQDIIPDAETKGYHVGVVRQPAEPVQTAAGTVGFESIAAEPSKFETAAQQKARSNAREAENPDLYGGTEFVPPTVRRADVTGAGHEERLRGVGIDVVDDDPKD